MTLQQDQDIRWASDIVESRDAEWTRSPRILVIDDEPLSVRLINRILSAASYDDIVSTTDAASALPLARSSSPDVVILDLHMPGFNGFDVLEALSALIGGRNAVPVLVLTADLIGATRRRAIELGATDFLTKPFENSELVFRIQNLLKTRLLQLTLEDHRSQLASASSRREFEVEGARLDLLEQLALSAESNDPSAARHMRNVGMISASLASRMGLDEATTQLIGRTAPLHDIGKIGVPEGIVVMGEPPSSRERDVLRSHTVIGARLLDRASSTFLQTAAVIARHHHERWDGSGYPDRLSGKAIPVPARIVAVADVFDALIQDRPYRKAFSESEAVSMIVAGSGSHFDPGVVNAFTSLDWVASRLEGFRNAV